MVAHLGQGDTLYVPAFWGQQSFAGLDAPVVTLGLELFPAAVAPDARPANRGAWGSILAGPPDGSEPEVRGERHREDVRAIGRKVAAELGAVCEEDSAGRHKMTPTMRWQPRSFQSEMTTGASEAERPVGQ